MIRMTNEIGIAEWELSESFSRASGPGGGVLLNSSYGNFWHNTDLQPRAFLGPHTVG